jgi:hypothetical protein
VQEQSTSWKNYESIGILLTEKKKYAESVEYFEMSSNVFYEEGLSERAYGVLIKAAESLAKLDNTNKKIGELYKKAISIMSDNEKFQYGMNAYVDYNNYLINLKSWVDVIDNLYEQKKAFAHFKQQHNIWKINLSLVIVYACGMCDLEQANICNEQLSELEKGYNLTNEYMCGERLISCLADQEKKDDNEFGLIKKEHCIKFIQQPISLLARRMKFENVIKNLSKHKYIEEITNDKNDESNL